MTRADQAWLRGTTLFGVQLDQLVGREGKRPALPGAAMVTAKMPRVLFDAVQRLADDLYVSKGELLRRGLALYLMATRAAVHGFRVVLVDGEGREVLDLSRGVGGEEAEAA